MHPFYPGEILYSVVKVSLPTILTAKNTTRRLQRSCPEERSFTTTIYGKGGEKMYHRYQGDSIGKKDADSIAEWYPKCKVRKEGDVYIATPHTTNPTRRTERKQKAVAVSYKDGKYRLTEMKDIAEDERVITGNDNDSRTADAKPLDVSDTVFSATYKQIFDELYDKYSSLRPYERKQAVMEGMLDLFAGEDDARYFVDENWRRKRRNLYSRRKRFEYKAYNQTYEFFFTVTYDDKKHTAESFEASLKSCFSNLHKRYGCLFQGVWEYGEENGRLHFHGLIADPNRKILDGLEKVREYNPKTGRMETFLQSKYFADRFGRNTFSEIIPQLYDNAIRYITKYLSKQGVRPYYSKGLYRFIESDICGKDVLGRMDDGSGRDIRLLVAGDFDIWRDGEKLGKVSSQTIALAPKLP